MLYAGKRPEDMTRGELEAAAVHCARMEAEAAQIRDLNRAALQELAEEYERRLPGRVN